MARAEVRRKRTAWTLGGKRTQWALTARVEGAQHPPPPPRLRLKSPPTKASRRPPRTPARPRPSPEGWNPACRDHPTAWASPASRSRRQTEYRRRRRRRTDLRSILIRLYGHRQWVFLPEANRTYVFYYPGPGKGRDVENVKQHSSRVSSKFIFLIDVW